ncbi:MAG: EAL domain-containing protein [Selenomonadaceae bacterium]|nr:EAL domain-containing protein [Selenomonadaceae bacterium]
MSNSTEQHSEQMDLLTGLPNITYFRSLSQKILDDPKERAKGLAFIYFNIKNFRSFNYYYGFDAGDRYLIKVGNIIHKVFPEMYVSRFADDHFMVIAYNNGIEDRLQVLREQATVQKMSKSMTIKAGIYVVPESGTQNAVRAYDKAKLACESIKDLLSTDNCYYTDELGQRERLREHIIESLDNAIINNHIKVFYQPIIHVVSGRLCGYEGLARWVDPVFGFLSPVDFITTLENARLIHRLDTYMIHKICYDIRDCIAKGFPVVPVSVNLSALDFQMTDMPVIASQALRETELTPDLLNLEITEAALTSENENIHNVLERFHSAGFEIWMDNFGSKYSSLNILEEVDIDLLKVDMRFLENFHTSSRSRAILKNIMNMAKEIGIRTLMEGVEDEEVLEFLRQTGCEKAQGYLFGKPAEIDDLRHLELNPEPSEIRSYYDAIGNVNLLSQTPLKTGWSEEDSKSTIADFNGIPLAIVEFDGRNFKFLMSNPSFKKVFKALGVDGKDTPDEVFNNPMLQFALKVHNAAQQCINEGNEIVRDFVTSEGFHNLRLRCIAYNDSTQVGALLAVVEQVSGNDTLNRQQRRDRSLRFLYSLYSRVDLLKLDGTEIENVYLNSSRYRDSFVRDSVAISVKNFSERNIYVEDRQKFIDFYDVTTFDTRLAEFGGNYIIDYFRTIDDNQNYSWQMYMLIPIIISGEKYLLSCARGIDAERMRRLPEIDKMGTEYYDMPGNPIFLLLAVRAFTSTFGYGTFEQFLNNSFYIEANLTDNRVFYMHLGKQGIISRKSYENLNYDETIRDVILNTVVEHGHRAVEKFFKRRRLLADYELGKIVGEMEFLRRPEENSKPRWLHTVYQLRESNETGDIHAYFLSFNVDDYRRTTEHLITLIERDSLTQLYNRGTAISFITDYLNNPGDRRGALVILDLDNFKQINDRFGHDCGDNIIKDAANRMEHAFGKIGVVARIGGDEFLVFIKDMDADQVDLMLQNFSSSIKNIDYKDQHITYTMSIGCAIYPDHGNDYKTLYQNADMALYSVKMSGRANYREFSPKMRNANRNQLGFSLNQISEGMPGGFLIYRDNEELEILYANKKLLDIYECESLEEFRSLTGNSFRGCVLSKDWGFVQDTINAQLNLSADYDYVQYRARTAKGRVIMLEDFGRLVHSADDGDIFYVFIIDLENKEKIYPSTDLDDTSNV